MTDFSTVLDANERARMLEEGYLPEVIDYHAQERYQKLVEEFEAKNRILGRYYTATPYFSFVGDVFPDVDRLMVITSDTTYKEMDVDELMEYQANRNDVYVAPANFINGCYSGDTCQNVYALVVDIDKIHPETLEVIIKNGNLGNRVPMPTYIVNSGSGVHFYYVFNKPIPYYYKNRKVLKDVYRVLCGITQKNILAKTDWHAITQPFRLPGSLSKIGKVVTGWKCGDKWLPNALISRLNVEGEELDLQQRPLLSQREYKEMRAMRKQQGNQDKPKTKKEKKWRSSLEGNNGFYEYCLARCYEKTPEGTRYLSMLGLVVVGYKVRLPKEKIEQDLLELLVHYNQIGKYMGTKEVQKALRAYNAKADKCRSTTLEQWFGWEFDRLASKRKAQMEAKGIKEAKKTRAEHLEEARAIRDIRMKRQGKKWDDNNGRKRKDELVAEWQQAHPNGKPKECIADTGISKNTVYKWWKS